MGKLIILILLLSSCDCNFHLARLEKKCGKIAKDTLVVHDTLITKEVQKDTVFKYFQRDSIIIREGKLVMKYYYNSHDSTVYLNGKCDSDTVVKVIKVPYDRTEVTVDYFPAWLKWVALILILALVVAKFLKLF